MDIRKHARAFSMVLPAAALVVAGTFGGVTAAFADTSSSVYSVATPQAVTMPQSVTAVAMPTTSGAGSFNLANEIAALHTRIASLTTGLSSLFSGSFGTGTMTGTTTGTGVMTGTTTTTGTGMGSTTSTGTGTTTPTGTGDGTSTSTPTGTGSTTTATLSASDLRVTLNNILRGHVSTSLEVLRAISRLPADASTSPELTATLAEQDQNAVDLSNAIGSVYGQSANTAFLTLFRAHIVDSNNYTLALKNGSMTDQQAALADLDLQLQAIASFLSQANPNLDYMTLLSALRQHESLVNQSSTDYVNGNYADSYMVEQQALTQISGGGDYIAAGIVAQYPNLFTK